MEPKKKIAFIINPVSGTQKKDHVPGLIESLLDKNLYEPVIVFTERPGHATELTHRFVKENYTVVVSVGGDGTVNEIGRALVDTPVALGILPFGSGNGLARHLNIPMDTRKAIQLLNEGVIVPVDYGRANDFIFFCVCGTGFDAHIGHKFATASKRGFFSYARLTLHEYRHYRERLYTLRLDGNQVLQKKAFLITFANANQWGNNAYINPLANIQDGEMEVCILSAVPLWAFPVNALRLFNKTLHKSRYMTVYRCKEAVLQQPEDGVFHFDGEPVNENKDICIKIIKGGLKMLVGKDTKLKLND